MRWSWLLTETCEAEVKTTSEKPAATAAARDAEAPGVGVPPGDP